LSTFLNGSYQLQINTTTTIISTADGDTWKRAFVVERLVGVVRWPECSEARGRDNGQPRGVANHGLEDPESWSLRQQGHAVCRSGC
jgi:hypothetical protein